MKLEDFKLIKNKQKPEMCYAYETKVGGSKYCIFTMNYGKTFLASIEERRLDGRYYSEFSKHNCSSAEEALEAINKETSK